MSSTKKSKVTITLIVALLIVALGSLAYQFLWGKLFVYSPMKLGFSRHELSNTIIYVQHGAKFDGYAAFDTYPPAVVATHELRFREKPVIYIFRDDEDYLRLSTTKARFCAYPNGGLVISPWALKEAQEGKISLETYLKHELSHTLLYQQMGVLNAYIYFPRWLLEGTAMYRADQMGTSWYPGRKETFGYIGQGNFIDPRDYATAREKRAVLNVKYPIAFMYSEFGYIVDDLIATFGKQKFMQYTRHLFSSLDHERVFKDVYGIDFDGFLLDFRKRVEEVAPKT